MHLFIVVVRRLSFLSIRHSHISFTTFVRNEYTQLMVSRFHMAKDSLHDVTKSQMHEKLNKR